MEFKDKLKELRTNKKLTQIELANELYVSRSLIAKWENGLGLPSEETLKLLCEFFNTTPEELIPTVNTEKNLVQKNITINKLKYYLLGVMSVGIVIIAVLSILLIISNINNNKHKTLTIEDAPNITINNQNFYRVQGLIDKANSQGTIFTAYNNYKKSDYQQMLYIEDNIDYVIKSNQEILSINGSYYYLDEDFDNEVKEIQLMWHEENKYPTYDLIFYDNTFGFADIKEEFSYIGVDIYCEYSNCIVKYFCLIKL